MPWYCLAIIIFGILIDQLTKYWAVTFLPLGQADLIIPGFIELQRLNNHGAAYNILTGKITLLFFISVIAVIILGYLLYNYRWHQPLLLIGLSCLLAGSVGNALDRGIRGYVVDMIYINVWNIPLLNFVCNLADIFISLGVILILIYLLHNNDKGAVAH